MSIEKNYIDVNRNSWNNRLEAHLKSDFYNVDGFMKGKSSLNNIELKLLGDLKGKSVLHLQCHFGQDTLSMARMGANVTGIDLSDKAIAAAREMAGELNIDAEFISCDLYELPSLLNKQFDIVYTSYGTIGWLPDLDRWASIISKFLKPEGKFVFVEFHPVVWMFDDEFEKVAYNYFNTGPIIETENGTYADPEAKITQEYICWNHSMSEVVNNLIKHQLKIKSLEEFDYSPYDCFRKTLKLEEGKYIIEPLENKIPMVYAIEAVKER